MTRKYGLPKTDRLKSRKIITKLFSEGKHVFQYPFKLVFTFVEESDQTTPIKMAVTVPKKLFKSAVKRNLIKRRTREAYRLTRPNIFESFAVRDGWYAIMFIYVGKEIETYAVIERSMSQVLTKLKHAIEPQQHTE